VTERDRYDSLIAWYAEHGRKGEGPFFVRDNPVPVGLLKRQLLQESAANPDAVSRVGAQGLAQAMEATWQEWVRNEFGGDPPPRRHISAFDPEDAIHFQCDYMAWLLGVFGQDQRKALAAYNAGIGRVQKLMKAHGGEWEQHLPDETIDYLRRILA
jgi:soluble lytic murein transglycosylase-like protein